MNSILRKTTWQLCIQDLFSAIRFLTQIPVPNFQICQRDLMQTAWSFSLVGAFIGFLGGIISWFLLACQVPIFIIACLTIGSLILLTGALHEDGLADMADGFGGGNTAENKIKIMRDSQIGTYGSLTLILVIGIKAASIDILLEGNKPELCIIALIVAGSISRSSLVFMALALDHASENGLGKFAGKPSRSSAVVSIFLALIIALFLLPVINVILTIILTLLVVVSLGLLSRTQIGGYTGDILGATQVLSETIILIYLATTNI